MSSMSSTSPATLAARDVHVVGRLHAVDLSLRPGEVTALVGENGAGKSTLLDVLAGVLAPSRGDVLLGDARIATLRPRERARRLQSLPQHEPDAAGRLVVERIAQGMVPRRGFDALLDDDARARVRAVAAELGVEGLLDRSLSTLSGGERRRVHVARALVDDADAYLLDEPWANVDLEKLPLVAAALRRRADRGAIVVASVHDLGVAAMAADRVVGLRGGRVVVDGPPLRALDGPGIEAIYGVRGARLVVEDGAIGVLVPLRSPADNAARAQEDPVRASSVPTFSTSR
jgi:iron complex transport system ATP-binding protein